MKRLKRMASMILTVMTCLMCMNIGTFAADAPTPDKGKIIISNDSSETNVKLNPSDYVAYRFLDLNMDESHTSFAYTLNDLSKAYFAKTPKKASETDPEPAKTHWDEFIAGTGEAPNTKYPFSDEVMTKANAVDPDKNTTVIEFISSLENASDIEAFANDVYSFVKGSSYTSYPAKAQNNDVAFENLPLGYYIIYGKGTNDTYGGGDKTVVSAVMLDTTSWDETSRTYEVTVNAKIGAPSIDKKIVLNKGEIDEEGTSKETLVNHSSANIGDTVDFRVTSSVPNVTGYKSYTFEMTDTMSKGLTYKEDSMEVKIKDTVINKLDNNAAEDATGYKLDVTTAEDTGVTTIKVTFQNFYKIVGVDNNKHSVGEPIIFDYSATLNKDAVIAPENNPNSAKITYSNDPTASDSKGETIEPKVYVYTYEFDIYKYTANKKDDAAKKPLANAEFELYRGSFELNADGSVPKDPAAVEGGEAASKTSISFVESNGTYRAATSSDETKVTTLKSDADGNIKITGLKEGEYTLVETKAPNGCNKLTDSVKVKIEAAYSENGDSVTGITADINTDDPAWEVLADKAGIKTNIFNSSVPELPPTGGMGTKLIYIGGSALMLGAVIGFTVRTVAKKKKDN